MGRAVSHSLLDRAVLGFEGRQLIVAVSRVLGVVC